MYRPAADFDNPWKATLEEYFESFVAFFFPSACAGIDWTRSCEFLEKELQQVTRDANLGRRLADKLVKVWLRSGDEVWVLVHVEIQNQDESGFEQRLFVYNYRIYDRYRRTVVTRAVLGDERPRWRPQQFGYELWGSRMAFQFPIVKLSDYMERWSELEASENPFATVVMSHLKAQETRGDARERKVWKLALTRGLYERGYARQDILNVFRFVDWVLALPEELEREFWQEIERYEEERNMPYITSVERMATARGIEQGIEQESVRSGRQSVYDALDVRFGGVPAELRDRLEEIADAERLRQLHRAAIAAPTLVDFEQLL